MIDNDINKTKNLGIIITAMVAVIILAIFLSTPNIEENLQEMERKDFDYVVYRDIATKEDKNEYLKEIKNRDEFVEYLNEELYKDIVIEMNLEKYKITAAPTENDTGVMMLCSLIKDSSFSIVVDHLKLEDLGDFGRRKLDDLLERSLLGVIDIDFKERHPNESVGFVYISDNMVFDLYEEEGGRFLAQYKILRDVDKDKIVVKKIK